MEEILDTLRRSRYKDLMEKMTKMEWVFWAAAMGVVMSFAGAVYTAVNAPEPEPQTPSKDIVLPAN